MVKPDKWIKEMSVQHKMIDPFEENRVTPGMVSFGLSSYGYDIRLSDEFKIPNPEIFANPADNLIDPKNFRPEFMIDFKNNFCIVPPNSFVLARTLEYFRIPRNVLTVCTGKSTYARCGVLVNVTPLEPEWEGYITMGISNTTPLPVKLYAFEGIAQIIFLESDEECLVSYADKKGKYQKQETIVSAKV